MHGCRDGSKYRTYSHFAVAILAEQNAGFALFRIERTGNMAKALIFLAEGYEEVEMLTVVDMVRRAKIDIDMVAIGDQRVVKSSHGVCITADRLLDEADFAEAQMLILPGGIPGTPNLRACDTLCQQLQQFAKEVK